MDSDSIRVLVNTPDAQQSGGVSTYCRLLLERLPIDTASFVVGRREPTEGRLRALSRMMADYLRFWRVLRRGGYDVVHVNTSLRPKAMLRDALFVWVAIRLKKKVFVMFHGWDPGFERTVRRWGKPLLRLTFFRAGAIMVLARDFQKSLVAMGCDASRTYLGSTIVDDSEFEFHASSVTRTRQLSDPFNVLFLARVEKYKGIYELLASYRLLKGRYPQCRLTIVGDGSEVAGAREYVIRNGLTDVVFTGYLEGDAKHQVFLRSHCYVLPSYAEGMPTSLLEAMSHGLPAVTTLVGGVRDFFVDGRMGYSVEIADPQVLSKSLELLLISPDRSAQMGQYNWDFAKSHFAASRVAAYINTIYHTL